jgi:ABC-type transporter Mla maintaining outer membrane lipid asymmetry permease subunit MlaE
MDFARAFTYVFDDPDWLKKIGIMALIFLIPIIGQLVLLGWMLRITRNVVANDPRPLPEMDFGADLGTGFQAFIVGLVYAIPILIVAIPFSILTASAANSSGNDAGVFVALASLCVVAFAIIYGLLLAFMLPAAYANMAVKKELGAGLRFGEIWKLVRSNPGAYLVVVAGTIVASLVAQLGVIACFIGALATYVYAMAINGHLYGQAYREATGGRESVAAPPASIPPAY